MNRFLASLLLTAALALPGFAIGGTASRVIDPVFVAAEQPTQYTGTLPAGFGGKYYYCEALTEEADPATLIHIDIEFSTNGGATWEYNGGFTTNGGPHFERDGMTPANPRINGTFPDAQSIAYRLTVTTSQGDEVGLQFRKDPLNPNG